GCAVLLTGAYSMGVQFWWFYDVIAVAVVLVSIFISVRKGLMKAVATLIGLVLSAVIAFSAGGPVAELMYEQSEKSSNIKKYELSLESVDFISDLGNQLETLGYNIRIDSDELRKAFNDEKDPEKKIYKYVNNINSKKVDEESIFINKLHESYAVVISNYIAKKSNAYSAEYGAEEIRKHPEKTYELAELLNDVLNRRCCRFFLFGRLLRCFFLSGSFLLRWLLCFYIFCRFLYFRLIIFLYRSFFLLFSSQQPSRSFSFLPHYLSLRPLQPFFLPLFHYPLSLVLLLPVLPELSLP
ncbi:MAG: CvpA family protein, partial [Schwartzia sp.]|nr:CvpA family protein [Schwartzia sp. (in: firmicutes)]